MNIKAIFGATFFSVLAALILYDLVVKGIVSQISNKYDNTYDPRGSKKNFANSREQKSHLQRLISGDEKLPVAA